MAETVDMNELNAAINGGKKDKVKEILRKVTPFTDDEFEEKHGYFMEMFKERKTFAEDEKSYEVATLKKLAGYFKREIKSSAEQFTGFFIGQRSKNWNDIAREKAIREEKRNEAGNLVYASGNREGQEIVGDDWETELYTCIGEIVDEGTPKANFVAKELRILAIRSQTRQTYDTLEISPFVVYQFRANQRDDASAFIRRISAVNITRYVPVFGEKHVDFVKAAKGVKGMKDRLKSISEVYDWVQKNKMSPNEEKFNDFMVVRGNPVSVNINPSEEKKNVVELEDDTVDFQSETQLMQSFSEKSVPIPFNDFALNVYVICGGWIANDSNQPKLTAMGYWCEEKFLREQPKKVTSQEIITEKKKATTAEPSDDAW